MSQRRRENGYSQTAAPLQQINKNNMRIKSRTLNIERFKKDFSKLYLETGRLDMFSRPDTISLLNDILQRIEEAEECITSFLRNLDSLEDSKVQMLCRQASIAQMFNIHLSYKEGYPYIEISSHSNDVILIKNADSTTCIVSKYGEIIFPEGKIWTQRGLNYGYGFPIFDMTNNRKVGFIRNSGARVLPCEFDYIEQHKYECPIIIYGTWAYDLMNIGELSSISKDDLEEIIECYDSDSKNIYFLSEDSRLYVLSPSFRSRDISVQEYEEVKANGHTLTAKEDAHNAIMAILSECTISKEKLQELLDSK